VRDKQDCPNPQWTIPLNQPKRSLPALAPQMAPLSLRQRKLLRSPGPLCGLAHIIRRFHHIKHSWPDYPHNAKTSNPDWC